jgi:hypothetical protein
MINSVTAGGSLFRVRFAKALGLMWITIEGLDDAEHCRAQPASEVSRVGPKRREYDTRLYDNGIK